MHHANQHPHLPYLRDLMVLMVHSVRLARTVRLTRFHPYRLSHRSHLSRPRFPVDLTARLVRLDLIRYYPRLLVPMVPMVHSDPLHLLVRLVLLLPSHLPGHLDPMVLLDPMVRLSQ